MGAMSAWLEIIYWWQTEPGDSFIMMDVGLVHAGRVFRGNASFWRNGPTLIVRRLSRTNSVSPASFDSISRSRTSPAAASHDIRSLTSRDGVIRDGTTTLMRRRDVADTAQTAPRRRLFAVLSPERNVSITNEAGQKLKLSTVTNWVKFNVSFNAMWLILRPWPPRWYISTVVSSRNFSFDRRVQFG